MGGRMDEAFVVSFLVSAVFVAVVFISSLSRKTRISVFFCVFFFLYFYLIMLASD